MGHRPIDDLIDGKKHDIFKIEERVGESKTQAIQNITSHTNRKITYAEAVKGRTVT